MFTTLFVVSFVSSSTRELDSSLNIALESVGRSVLGWVGFISDCCGEDSRACEFWSQPDDGPPRKRAETFSCFLQQFENAVVLRRTFIDLISTSIESHNWDDATKDCVTNVLIQQSECWFMLLCLYVVFSE
jgi:hypothetical protein